MVEKEAQTGPATMVVSVSVSDQENINTMNSYLFLHFRDVPISYAEAAKLALAYKIQRTEQMKRDTVSTQIHCV